jgi:hypothetical protein
MNLKNNAEQNKLYTQQVRIVWLHLSDVLDQTKLISVTKLEQLPIEGEGLELTGKGH